MPTVEMLLLQAPLLLILNPSGTITITWHLHFHPLILLPVHQTLGLSTEPFLLAFLSPKPTYRVEPTSWAAVAFWWRADVHGMAPCDRLTRERSCCLDSEPWMAFTTAGCHHNLPSLLQQPPLLLLEKGQT